MSKVSIIMPVYNAERYLGEAIESVLKQTYGESIRLYGKKSLEKLKYNLIKRKMDTLVLFLGCMFLKWKESN